MTAAAVAALLLASVGAGWFPQEPLRQYLEHQLAKVGAGATASGSARIGRLHVVPLLMKVQLRPS